MRHRNPAVLVWMFVLVVRATDVGQCPTVGLEPGDNVPAGHWSKIHTLHTGSRRQLKNVRFTKKQALYGPMRPIEPVLELILGHRGFRDIKHFPGIRYGTGHGSGGDHEGAHQDGAAGGAALAAFEVAVR